MPLVFLLILGQKSHWRGEQNEFHKIMSASRMCLQWTLSKHEALAKYLFNVQWSHILEEEIIFRQIVNGRRP